MNFSTIQQNLNSFSKIENITKYLQQIYFNLFKDSKHLGGSLHAIIKNSSKPFPKPSIIMSRFVCVVAYLEKLSCFSLSTHVSHLPSSAGALNESERRNCTLNDYKSVAHCPPESKRNLITC